MDIATADIDTRYAIQHQCKIVERAVESLTLTGNTSPELLQSVQEVLDNLSTLLGGASGGIEPGEYAQYDYTLENSIGRAEIQYHPVTGEIVIRNVSMS